MTEAELLEPHDRTAMSNVPTCYLCGLPIEEDASREHVVPAQFFPAAIRGDLAPLLVLPSHPECNQAYMRDEEYFYQSVSPLAWKTKIGAVLKSDMARRYRGGSWEHRERLARMVLGEFDRQPSGIWLPAGYVAKHVDARRGENVLWKILRGLFYHEHERVLPADTTFRLEVLAEDSLPPEYEAFTVLESRAHESHRPFFDYRFWAGELDGIEAQVWGLLLWQKILGVCVFHDPGCSCSECVGRE